MTPAETAQAFLAALDARDWPLAASLLAADFAGHLRSRELSRLLGRAERLQELGRTKPPEGPLGFNRAYSPELLARFGSTPVYNLPGVATVAELAAMPDRPFLEAWLSSSSRWLPEFAEAPETAPTRQVAGEEPGNGPDQLFVPYVFSVPNAPVGLTQPAERLLLQQTPDGWRIAWTANPRPPLFVQFLELSRPEHTEAAG